MLTYTFEQRNDKPYYQYLYECIKEDIEKGNLTEGAKLPSKRAFAKQLGLSVMTIASAYEQLLVEGYIVAEEKKGYYVAGISRDIERADRTGMVYGFCIQSCGTRLFPDEHLVSSDARRIK